MADRITSLGVGTTHDENVTINSSGGSDPNWTCVLNAVSGAVVGDLLLDEGGNEYLITGGTGTVNLTLFDLNAIAAAPDTTTGGQSEVYRSYTTITAWNADLTDTVLYGAGFKAAVGKMYNDADFDESAGVLMDDGGTASLTAITLEPASGEAPTGLAGTGVRWSVSGGASSPQSCFILEQSAGVGDSLNLKHFEIDGNNQANTVNFIFNDSNSSGHVGTVHGLLLHHMASGDADNEPINANVRDLRLSNLIIYRIVPPSGVTDGFGAFIDADQAAGGCAQLTVFHCQGFSSGKGRGLRVQTDSTNGYFRNNICVDTNTVDYEWPASPVNIDSDWNLSEDATADDAGGSNNLVSQTLADIFVDTSDGDENLALQDADSPAHDPSSGGGGNDLGAGVYQVDAAGIDREVAHSNEWDMGALQFIPVVGSGIEIFRRRIEGY